MRRIPFLLFSAVLLLSIANCSKIGQLCKDLPGFNFTIATNAVTTPGSGTYTTSVTNTISTDLSKYGADVSKVNSLTILPIVVTINGGYTFADIESATITANGQTLGTLPAGATGTTVTFNTPSNTDIKTNILLASTINLVITANFKKAVPASTLTANIPVNACYQVL